MYGDLIKYLDYFPGKVVDNDIDNLFLMRRIGGKLRRYVSGHTRANGEIPLFTNGLSNL